FPRTGHHLLIHSVAKHALRLLHVQLGNLVVGQLAQTFRANPTKDILDGIDEERALDEDGLVARDVFSGEDAQAGSVVRLAYDEPVADFGERPRPVRVGEVLGFGCWTRDPDRVAIWVFLRFVDGSGGNVGRYDVGLYDLAVLDFEWNLVHGRQL